MVTTPHGMADRAARIWNTYVKNAGMVRVLDRGEHMLDLEYADIPHAFPGFWRFLAGTIVGTLELTSARGIKVIPLEGGGTASRCRYRVTWR